MSTMNTSAAARTLNIHENRVFKLIKDGEIPAAKIGRGWVMMERDVIAYAERQIAEQTASRLGVPTRAGSRGRSRAAKGSA